MGTRHRQGTCPQGVTRPTTPVPSTWPLHVAATLHGLSQHDKREAALGYGLRATDQEMPPRRASRTPENDPMHTPSGHGQQLRRSDESHQHQRGSFVSASQDGSGTVLHGEAASVFGRQAPSKRTCWTPRTMLRLWEKMAPVSPAGCAFHIP